MFNRKSKNAITHGAFASDPILPWEDGEAFAALHRAIREELGPNGPLEEGVVREIAELEWRKRRLTTAYLLHFYTKPVSPELAKAARGGPAELAAYVADANKAEGRLRLSHAEMLDLAKATDAGDLARAAKIRANAESNASTALPVPLAAAYDPDAMSRQLKTEAQIDARIAKLMGRLVGLKEYKIIYNPRAMNELPPTSAPPTSTPPTSLPDDTASPAELAKQIPMSGADLYR